MKTIGTHNGTFHCDEVFACFMLKQLPEYKDAEIVRSRNQDDLNNCDIVVDVGGVFDHSKKRYDHHHKSFAETFKSLCPNKPWEIKLSSAGLVYVYYGKQVLTEMCKAHKSDIDIDRLYDKVYDKFVLEIDAIDNGVTVSDGELKYTVNSGISSRVGQLNPWWNSENVNEEVTEPESKKKRKTIQTDDNLCREQFEKAMKLVGAEFTDRVDFYVRCWWPARSMVRKMLTSRYEVHPSGAILCLEKGGCPWKMHLLDLEKENVASNGDDQKTLQKPLFVLYPDRDSWRVQCIPIDDKQTFKNRLSLHADWRGVRDEELSKISGIPGCVFVHASGFIGGNKTYEGALKMAVKTFEASDKLV